MGLILSKARRRARQRGFASAVIEEIFTTAAIMACFVAPLAGTARAVGPRLSSEMDQRIHETMMQEPDGRQMGRGSSQSNSPDDGLEQFTSGFERGAGVASELVSAAKAAASAGGSLGQKPSDFVR